MGIATLATSAEGLKSNTHVGWNDNSASKDHLLAIE
jgi:hypothetical protein